MANHDDEGMVRRRARAVGYWITTIVIVWEMTAGSLWDLLQIEFTRGVFVQLGYPSYLLLILGAWKLPCAIALLVPRFPRLKEWAYAGAVFTYTGASASHLFAGEGLAQWAGPAVFAAMALASWALRPVERRVSTSATLPPLPLRAWALPLVAIAALAALAYATLPQGPPPT
ncbi:MAG TPA: DoxX family protein [Myxococcota bacterium]